MITEIQTPKKIYIKFINNQKGWGVFCKETISNGEIVEDCYCVIDNYETSSLKNYVFAKKIGTSDTYHCLGYGAVYNHSENENLRFEIIDEPHNIIRFIATKDIQVGEELCHYYGDDWLEKFNKTNKLI